MKPRTHIIIYILILVMTVSLIANGWYYYKEPKERKGKYHTVMRCEERIDTLHRFNQLYIEHEITERLDSINMVYGKGDISVTSSGKAVPCKFFTIFKEEDDGNI